MFSKERNLQACFISYIQKKNPSSPPASVQGKVRISLESPALRHAPSTEIRVTCASPVRSWVFGSYEHPLHEAMSQQAAGRGGGVASPLIQGEGFPHLKWKILPAVVLHGPSCCRLRLVPQSVRVRGFTQPPFLRQSPRWPAQQTLGFCLLHQLPCMLSASSPAHAFATHACLCPPSLFPSLPHT